MVLSKSFNLSLSNFSYLPNESKEWSSYMAANDDQK